MPVVSAVASAQRLRACLAAVLLRPGRLVAEYLAGPRRHYFRLGLGLAAMVAVATAVLYLLQRHGAAWAALRPHSPPSPAQLALAGQHMQYWGVFSNLRQLALLPLYAVPTWLLYRRHGAGYAEALLMQAVANLAFNLYALLCFALMAGGYLSITTRGTGWQLDWCCSWST